MSNLSIEKISDVVGNIYEAAYDQGLWSNAVEGIRDLIGGSRACIVRVEYDLVDAVSTELDPEFNCQEAVEAHRRDPLTVRLNAVPVGTILRRSGVPGQSYHRSDFWQNWLRPRDMFDGLVCNLASSHKSALELNVHRGSRQDGFSGADIDVLQKLTPHILRAGEIGRSFEKAKALSSAFSHLPFGILLVDGHQRVAHLNEAAEALLRRAESPLSLKSGVVVASDPGDRKQLQRMVVNACSSSDGATPGLGGTFILPSEHAAPETPRLVLSIAPYVNARQYGLASERLAVVMIRELTSRSPDDLIENIRTAFRFTNSEAKLAASLAAGHSLKVSAERQKIQFSTARYYLEQIFQKTRTHRQSELVELLKLVNPIQRSVSPQ